MTSVERFGKLVSRGSWVVGKLGILGRCGRSYLPVSLRGALVKALLASPRITSPSAVNVQESGTLASKKADFAVNLQLSGTIAALGPKNSSFSVKVWKDSVAWKA